MVALIAGSIALAASPSELAQQNELDRIRATVADEVQLAAFDLVDELVYGWTTDPVFPAPTPVVLAGVTVPVGLGTGMQSLLENHVANVLTKNPSTHVQLVHCPTCQAVVVHSGPEATVVSRGIDDPDVLHELGDGATGRHALFLDVEAEGSWLVLRARLTKLTPELPIVWSHTLSTSASTPAMLREPDHLKSAAEARDEYLDTLRDRGPLSVPLRVAIRTFAQGSDNSVPPPPLLWAETGVELGTTSALAWTGSVVVGYSFIPQAYQGLLAQGRVNRLITGRARSHTRPDLYAFVGAAAMSVWGPAMAPFRDRLLTADELLVSADADPPPTDPRSTFGALSVGLDLRVGQRMGMSAFLENLPAYGDSPNLGDHVNLFGLGFQSLGTEVTFWF